MRECARGQSRKIVSREEASAAPCPKSLHFSSDFHSFPAAEALCTSWALSFCAGDPHGELFTKDTKSRFDLIQARNMSQIQQAIDLRQPPTQALSEIRSSNVRRTHRGIQCDFCFREDRQSHEVAPFDGCRLRNRTLVFDVAHERCLKRIRCPGQGLCPIFAERVRLGYIPEFD